MQATIPYVQTSALFIYCYLLSLIKIFVAFMLPHSKKTFFTCIPPRKACFHSSVYSVSIKVLKGIIFHGLFLVHQIRFTAQICYKVQL